MDNRPRIQDHDPLALNSATEGNVVSFFEGRRRCPGHDVFVLVGNGEPELDAVLVGCVESSLAPARVVHSRIFADARELLSAAVAERPDLVLLTPVLTGFPRTGGSHSDDVAAWIRRLTDIYDVAVIYFHPRSEAADAAPAILGAGATAMLGMPVLPAELMRAIREVF